MFDLSTEETNMLVRAVIDQMNRIQDKLETGNRTESCKQYLLERKAKWIALHNRLSSLLQKTTKK
jgi:hypothetical protein